MKLHWNPCPSRRRGGSLKEEWLEAQSGREGIHSARFAWPDGERMCLGLVSYVTINSDKFSPIPFVFRCNWETHKTTSSDTELLRLHNYTTSSEKCANPDYLRQTPATTNWHNIWPPRQHTWQVPIPVEWTPTNPTTVIQHPSQPTRNCDQCKLAHTYIHSYTHTHIHKYTHTHTHTYIHT